MPVYKCKMCGGDVELTADKTLGTCEYCGCTMTFPKVDDDQRAAAFNRGNHFRRTGEFDKALSVYERIVNEDDNDAEAHWCCALCRFGIEYVEDPATFEWLPTMHRLSYDSFLEDVDYLAAVEHSNGITQRQYQKDAMKIAEVQRGILATSQNEEPFDVFICYKESDENGNRTVDSSLAQDIYYQLTDKGYKVFFSRITLEDKVGTEYEPYIFAALNSAKVMLVIGTKPEYLNAVWVKNEWSRFIAMMKKDRKRVLLPCYRGMDPYDMPEALSVLQSYDMAKIGFIQDLIRGIEKIVAVEEQKTTVKETVVVQQTSNSNAAPLLKRAFMFLEDEEWDKADDFCEQVLNIDPECAEAYLGKLMTELKIRKQDNLKDCDMPFDNKNNYSKAYKFADEALKSKLSDDNKFIRERNETERKEGIYSNACELLKNTISESECYRLVKEFESIKDYKDSAQKIKECEERAIVCHNDNIYRVAVDSISADTIDSLHKAIKKLTGISDWKDSVAKIEKCKERIAELEEKYRLEKEKAERDRIVAEKAAKKRKKITAIVFSSVAVCIAFVIILNTVIIPLSKYNSAITMMNDGRYDEAIAIFTELGEYSDSESQIDNCKNMQSYDSAVSLMNNGNYDEAIAKFSELGEYSDSKEKVSEIKYSKALLLMNDGNYDEAIVAFSELGTYSDSAEKIKEIREIEYAKALSMMNEGKYDEASLIMLELINDDEYKEKINKAILAILGTRTIYIDKKYSNILTAGSVWDYKKIYVAVSFSSNLSCSINNERYRYKIIDIDDNSLVLELTGDTWITIGNTPGLSINNTIKVCFSDSGTYILIKSGGSEIRFNEE